MYEDDKKELKAFVLSPGETGSIAEMALSAQALLEQRPQTLTPVVALGTTAPEGSRTVPVTEVELPPDCAQTLDEEIVAKKSSKNEKVRVDSITPLLQERDKSQLRKALK